MLFTFPKLFIRTLFLIALKTEENRIRGLNFLTRQINALGRTVKKHPFGAQFMLAMRTTNHVTEWLSIAPHHLSLL